MLSNALALYSSLSLPFVSFAGRLRTANDMRVLHIIAFLAVLVTAVVAYVPHLVCMPC